MSKSSKSKVQWPTVAQVCEELTWVRDRCCEVPPNALNDNPDGDDEQGDGPFDDEDDGYMDVRLQVYPGGSWALRTGDASYDTDHRGYWGAGSLAWDSDCEELAAALIDEAKDNAAMNGEDVDDECGECGQEMDKDCNGNPRCPDCDGPCPCCYDGPGPG
jgi:hypothetical protein